MINPIFNTGHSKISSMGSSDEPERVVFGLSCSLNYSLRKMLPAEASAARDDYVLNNMVAVC